MYLKVKLCEGIKGLIDIIEKDNNKIYEKAVKFINVKNDLFLILFTNNLEINKPRIEII